MKMLWCALCVGLSGGLVRAADTPKIHFEQTLYDLGNVIEGEVPSGKFFFRNAGTGMLELGKVETSCGCTVAAVKPEKLKPGETGEVAFTLDLTNIRGPTDKSIDLPSNDPLMPVTHLIIKATVKPVFEFNPQLVFFDEVRPGETAKGLLQIKRLDGKKLHITKVRSKEFVTVKVEPEEDSKGQSARLLIEAKPEGKPGIFSDMLRVHIDDSEKALLLIPLAGQLLGGIKAEPQELVWNIPDPDHWPGPNPDATTVRRLVVSCVETNRELELRDFASDLEDLLVQVAVLEKGKKYQVLLKLDQPRKESTQGVITFETSLPTQPRLEVPIKINVAKP